VAERFGEEKVMSMKEQLIDSAKQGRPEQLF
jgi:hypothetical protein